MYLSGLDELDQKILQLLIENARYSYSEIGERIGVSRVAVKTHINALEEQGIIEEYTAVINPHKLSGAISCYFEGVSVDGGKLDCSLRIVCFLEEGFYKLSFLKIGICIYGL